MNMVRSLVLLILAAVVLVILMMFINLFLKIAIGIALIALAYYWWVRASEARNRRLKHWRQRD